jgi:hypothetical protein
MLKKRKTQWRSRRKVDVVNCKGFAQRQFVWYWFVQIFRPRRVAIYILRTTQLLADYSIVYLHLKKTNTTKIEKGLMRESNSSKTNSWPVVNHRLTRLHHVLHLAYPWLPPPPCLHQWISWLTIGWSVGPIRYRLDCLIHRRAYVDHCRCLDR